jgi:DNA-binding CsgD family transcriptional regulator
MVLLKPALLTALGVLAVKLLNTLLVYHFFTFEYYLAFVAVVFLLGGYLISPAFRRSKKGEVMIPIMVMAQGNEELSALKSIRYSLSNRELTVFRYLANGNTNKEIASNLGVELSTVKTHINNLYTKINCTNRKGALETWDKMVQNDILS